MRICKPELVALHQERPLERFGQIVLRNAVMLDLLVIIVLWCLAVILVNPLGSFPLNDDWSYGAAVKRLLEEGGYRPTGWTAMTLVSQVIWGALFCVPWGFSFTALRFSTLTLALLGVSCLYLLLRQLSAGRVISFLASITLAFTPLYFALSHTYMTDVPFTCFTLFSAFFFLRYIMSDSDSDWLLGLLCSVAATLCRQLGIFLPLAFALTLIIKKGLTIRALIRAFLPSLIVLAVLFYFNYWLSFTGNLPKEYNRNVGTIVNILAGSDAMNGLTIIISNIITILMYLGLSIWPLLPLMKSRVIDPRSLRFIPYIISISFFICSAYWLYHSNSTMPLAGNVIIKGGIGPIILADIHYLLLPHEPVLPQWIWFTITLFSLLGASILVLHIISTLINMAINIRRMRENNHEMALLFLLVSATIYTAPIILGEFYDRYLIPLLPFTVAIIAPSLEIRQLSLRRLHVLVAATSLVLLTAYSIAGTHDYLTWNRTRWEALQDLTQRQNIPVSMIDGGFEFNGWYLYDDNFQKRTGKSWWWVNDDAYMITLGEVQGYDIVRQYRFYRWMPAGAGQILVLRRRG